MNIRGFILEPGKWVTKNPVIYFFFVSVLTDFCILCCWFVKCANDKKYSFLNRLLLFSDAAARKWRQRIKGSHILVIVHRCWMNLLL